MTLVEAMQLDPSPEASIVNRRSTRFSGETQTCNLSELSTESLEGLRWLYRWLEMVGEHSSKDLSQTGVRGAIEALVSHDNVDRVVDAAANLRPAEEESIRLARVLHDLRGGALHQLVGLADLWLTSHAVDGELETVAILARDHAKVLRHSLVGLDEERRLLDSARSLHGVENLRVRFPFLSLYNGEGKVSVEFAAEWSGDFAITCLEFSTTLKLLYNLMDNAVRHTTDQKVLVRADPKPRAEPRSVRFVVANALTPAERGKLSPTGLAKLWRGYTTTGSGLGLVAGAALVSEAFGIEGPEQAVDWGYVGSRLAENGYIAWFHWPVVVDGAA